MEKNIIKTGVKNTLYVLMVQGINLILSISRNLILPLLLGINNFGYWQIYLLYVSFIGVFSLGFNDGIYLKYGKYDYDKLPRKVFRTSIRIFLMFEVVITIIAIFFVNLESDVSKHIPLLWAAINIPIIGFTGVLLYVLQITNQIKKYSIYTLIDKIFILIAILLMLYFQINNYYLLIIVDTFSRMFVLIMMIILCKEIIFGKGSSYIEGMKEALNNIGVGIKLLIANFAGMLVLGFGRFLVERNGSINEYAAYAFSISTMNLVLIFVSSVALVIYPTLSRLNSKKFSDYFENINDLVSILSFGLLISLFPLKLFIDIFMPNYDEVLSYLHYIFAIIYIQTKMQILINSYYKLLREESKMLSANIVGLIYAILLVTPLYFLTDSIQFVALGSLLAMMIRLYISEYYLRKKLMLSNKITKYFEVLGLMMFIAIGKIENYYLGFLLYISVYFLYLLIKRKKIKFYISDLFGR